MINRGTWVFPHPVQPWRGLGTARGSRRCLCRGAHAASGFLGAGKTGVVVLRERGLQKVGEKVVTTTW